MVPNASWALVLVVSLGTASAAEVEVGRRSKELWEVSRQAAWKCSVNDARIEHLVLDGHVFLPPLHADGDLEDAVTLMTEKLVSLLDLIELEAVRDKAAQVGASGSDDIHEPSHPLLAAGTKGCDDPVVA